MSSSALDAAPRRGYYAEYGFLWKSMYASAEYTGSVVRMTRAANEPVPCMAEGGMARRGGTE